MKKIYTILILLFNVIFRRKHYVLTFVAEHDSQIKRWYYKFPHWGFEHGNLEMVSGADSMCEYYAEGKDEVTVDVIALKEIDAKTASDGYDFFEGLKQEGSFKDKLLLGRTYQNVKANKEGKLVIRTIWICPVTLFVLGRYPNVLYIKKHG
jgi:hypothetical protein